MITLKLSGKKMKITLKSAYNLAEMMLVIAIISFILILTFSTIKPSKKTIPLAYYRAFSSLEQAAYNVFETLKENDKNFPGEETDSDPKKAAKELCSLIATNPDKTDNKGYINTVIYNCAENFKTIDRSGKDYLFKDSNMAFQAANSMKFYISPLEKVSVKNAVSKNQRVEIKYFIVWVDLNGNRTPNTADYTKKKVIDIVPFIVTTQGVVLPTGYPATDINYLSAYVEYPLSTKPSFSELKTYYEAQTAAFGGKEYPIYDAYSIRDSLQKSLYGTAAQIRGYFPKDETYEKLCKPAKNTDEPLCKIKINEKL